jgi:hypothetical protein
MYYVTELLFFIYQKSIYHNMITKILVLCDIHDPYVMSRAHAIHVTIQ